MVADGGMVRWLRRRLPRYGFRVGSLDVAWREEFTDGRVLVVAWVPRVGAVRTLVCRYQEIAMNHGLDWTESRHR